MNSKKIYKKQINRKFKNRFTHCSRNGKSKHLHSIFFSEDVHEEGLKVEGLYPYHIYTYIINELMGTPIEKNLPPKIEHYIQKKQLVTMEELLTIYEWPEKLMTKNLRN